MNIPRTEPLISMLYTVAVPGRPVQESIRVAFGDNVNSIIKTKTAGLSHSPGDRLMGIWHPNLQISSGSAVDQISSMVIEHEGRTYQGRAATTEEVAAYEEVHHAELKGTILAALGEKISEGPNEYFPFRHLSGNKPRLQLYSLLDDWDDCDFFLVVFEEEVSEAL